MWSKCVTQAIRRIARPFWHAYQDLLAPWDLRRLDLIRGASFCQLKDPAYLEKAIIKMGLYPSYPEILKDFPKDLWKDCGKGLRIWQYPIQLSPYLIQLHRYRIKVYLEIGVAHGGTFLVTIEYLRRFNPELKAIGIDPIPPSAPLRLYLKRNKSVRYIQDYSSNLGRYEAYIPPKLDLVLIDGDHSEQGCWNDFVLTKDRAKIIAFNDIVQDTCPEVGKVWRRVKEEYREEYGFFEFTQQYEEVIRRTGQRSIGMGLAIKKTAEEEETLFGFL